jgi:CHAD domain-containing protein
MKTPKKYLKNREDAIRFLLRKPRSKYTPETFHKLRLEIKKLNAFFDLIKYCSKDFKRKKAFKPFQLIFRQAGKVRELQLEEAMLKKYLRYNSLQSYCNNLKIMRQKEADNFFLMVDKSLLEQLEKTKELLRPNLSKIDSEKTDLYLEKKQKKIKKIISKGISEKRELHQLRIRLKILNHNNTIYKIESTNKSLPKKEDLTLLLGNWHDYQVIIKHLKKTLKNSQLSLEELNHLKAIKIKVAAESLLLFDKINNKLPQYKF